jgi:hypothetical protein
MKTIGRILLYSLISLYAGSVSAQVKQAAFKTLPANIALSPAIFQQIFDADNNSAIQLAFSDQFTFRGMVMSNRKPYPNLQTVIVKTDEFQNALLQFSKIIGPDLQVSYTGKIIPMHATDGYSLKKDEKQQYHLEKFELKNMLQDCSFN